MSSDIRAAALAELLLDHLQATDLGPTADALLPLLNQLVEELNG